MDLAFAAPLYSSVYRCLHLEVSTHGVLIICTPTTTKPSSFTTHETLNPIFQHQQTLASAAQAPQRSAIMAQVPRYVTHCFAPQDEGERR
jgi:hypothetical protein